MGIETYSKTAGNNTNAPPNGAPEGMPPSAVNDIMRQMMADLRTWYEAPQWINYGSAGLMFFDATNFIVTGDQTATYAVGRRVMAVDNSAVLYGVITASAYSAPSTKVTVALDTGAFDSNLTAVSLGYSLTGKPINANGVTFPAGSIPFAALAQQPGTVSTKANNYPIVATDNNGTILFDASLTPLTGTLPNPAVVGNGFKVTIEKKDTSANAVTVAVFASETIDQNGAPLLTGPGQSITLITDGTNWFKLAVKKPKTYTLLNTAGTTTYTTPAGCVGIYREVQAPGGGGGGYGGGTNGGNGGNSTFGDITANGGQGGVAGNAGAPGAGGAGGTGGILARSGGQGTSATTTSGPGGGTASGPGAGGAPSSTSFNAPAGSGGGGGGGASRAANTTGAGPGGGGEYRKGPIAGLPAATYSATVGIAGTAGAGSTSPGGAGDVGFILLEESY